MVFIYLLENHAKYGPAAVFVFDRIRRPGHSAVTSTITLTELLVPLYKQEHAEASGLRIRLETYPNLEWIPPHTGIADLAAQFRARYQLRTPDALHAATALSAEATGFVTNDRQFDRVAEFETFQLDSLLPGA